MAKIVTFSFADGIVLPPQGSCVRGRTLGLARQEH